MRVTGRLTGSPSVDQEVYAGQPVAPRITAVKPTVSGTTTAGSTLTAKSGVWGPSGVALAYRWLANGVAISGATAKTFVLTNAQAGKTISFKVTGSRSGSTSVSSTSLSTAAVRGVLTARKPTITGTAQRGKVLTANVLTWTPSPVTLRYQWLRDGVAITGATGRTHTLTSGSVGKRITVRVTGSKTSYITRSSTSGATAVVKS
ncbi:MAG: hypothetical protein EON52_16615 [Actinomycetales bacterium]|nr:MAG: hypothetical protein EON52_16615 [Actinomycetales bacterium]